MNTCPTCTDPHPDFRALAEVIDQATNATVGPDDRITFYGHNGLALTPPLCKWGAHVVLAHGGDEEFAAIAYANGYDR
jgi:hypothetical protein